MAKILALSLALIAILALALDGFIRCCGFFVGIGGLHAQAFWLFLPPTAAACCAFFFGLCLDCSNSLTPMGLNAFFGFAAVLFFHCASGHLRWDPRKRLLLSIPFLTALHCLLLSAAVSFHVTASAVLLAWLGESAFNCAAWRVFFWRNGRKCSHPLL